MIAFITSSPAKEVDWKSLPDQEWFQYGFAIGMIVILLDKAHFILSKDDGVEIKKDVFIVLTLQVWQ